MVRSIKKEIEPMPGADWTLTTLLEKRRLHYTKTEGIKEVQGLPESGPVPGGGHSFSLSGHFVKETDAHKERMDAGMAQWVRTDARFPGAAGLNRASLCYLT